MSKDASAPECESRVITSGAAMQAFGAAFARHLHAGDVVLLHGNLGAGKTTLTQGIAVGLGVEDAVQSPTFTLVQEHRGTSLSLNHLDLYRLDDPSELEGMGYETYLDPVDGVTVVEWPERAGDWLPEQFWLVRIEHLGGDRRRLSVRQVNMHESERRSE